MYWYPSQWHSIPILPSHFWMLKLPPRWRYLCVRVLGCVFALVFTQENVSLSESVPRAKSDGGMGVLAACDFFLTPDIVGVASSLIFGVFLINCLNMVYNWPFTKSPSSLSSSSLTSALLLDKGPICLIPLVKGWCAKGLIKSGINLSQSIR